MCRALRTRSGRFIVLGALLGGPVGMTGYVNAIHRIGPAYTAVISALFLACGALLSWVFLKEKMGKLQLAGLAVSIIGVIGLSDLSGELSGSGIGGLSGGSGAWFGGMACALLCVFGWSAEAVICAYGMKDPDVGEEEALQIRQLTSALFYGVVILPAVSGWSLAVRAGASTAGLVVLTAALAGTASYIMYYRAIHRIGPVKAMALDITYSAWSLVFSALFLGALPDGRGILCAVLVIGGTLAVTVCAPAKK